jgi:hypothetical protein
MFKNKTANSKRVWNKIEKTENKELAKGKISDATQNIILHVYLYKLHFKMPGGNVCQWPAEGGFLCNSGFLHQ